MTVSESAPDRIPSAHVVGNMFVEHYYPILHQQPEEVHKFYKDCSVLSRPDSTGLMQSVTTIQAIDEMVMSLDSKSYMVEIKTVDAQHSFKDGVVVLVTGLLTGKDNTTQKFTQSFFLAPMDMERTGYFVLNDVFRFIANNPFDDGDGTMANEPVAVGASTPTTPLDEPAISDHDISNNATTLLKTNGHIKAQEPSKNDCTETHDVEEKTAGVTENGLASELDRPSADSQYQHDTSSKKSYASIVKDKRRAIVSPSKSSPVAKVQTSALKIDMQPVKQYPAAEVKVQTAPVSIVQTAAVVVESQTDEKSLASASSQPETSIVDKKTIAENRSSLDASEGFSIYIRNLPLNATPSLVESEFKKFGAIKPGGVQVRNHKHHGYCFGFVEFETLTSMESAIEASVVIWGHQIVIEEKRTTTRVGPGGVGMGGIRGGRGRFPMQRGGFRNDNFQGYGLQEYSFRDDGMRPDGYWGRGGYAGGPGYGRNDFRSRGDFYHRGRGGYQGAGRLNMNQRALYAA